MNRHQKRWQNRAGVPDGYDQGVRFLDAGDYSQAAACFRRLSPSHPLYFAALGNLGWLALQDRQPAQAVDLLQQSLALKPDHGDALNTLGVALQALGRLPEAVDRYRQVLAMRPDDLQAMFNLASALHDLGHLTESVTWYRRLLDRQPHHLQALSNLGIALNHLGQSQEALACYQKILISKPNHLEALNNLGLTWHRLGRLAEAEKCFRKALAFSPRHGASWSNLGLVLHDLFQWQEAEACFRQALAQQPEAVEVLNNLGRTLQQLARPEEAAACYRQALNIRPDAIEVLNNLGELLKECGRWDEAEACFRKVLARQPDHGNALVMSYYCAQHQCQWQNLRQDCETLCAAVADGVDLQPFPLLSLPYDVIARPSFGREQRACASTHAQAFIPPEPAGLWQFDPVPNRLKIGYLSHDFQNHPVACFASGVFGCHDRQRFEITAYSYGRDDGRQTRRQVMATVDHFVDLHRIDNRSAARRILADGVHILVEMTGYTKGHRLAIAASRPAPVQVATLGYPGTLGLSCVDYFVSCPFIIPPGLEELYTEKIVYLPDGLGPVDWRRQGITLRTPRRQEYGLPAEGLVFANFNANYKISPSVFRIWMQVLEQTPGSVLWLWHSNPLAAANLRREAAAAGVDSDRLHFAPCLPYEEHLSLFRLVDLFLDTFPYNASSTANDALWAGCPILTCTGDTCISRAAGYQLLGVGLGDLITDSLAAYASLALALARQPQRLREIRQRLHDQLPQASLFDRTTYTRSLEQAYEAMWLRFQQGLPPDHIRVS